MILPNKERNKKILDIFNKMSSEQQSKYISLVPSTSVQFRDDFAGLIEISFRALAQVDVDIKFHRGFQNLKCKDINIQKKMTNEYVAFSPKNIKDFDVILGKCFKKDSLRFFYLLLNSSLYNTITPGIIDIYNNDISIVNQTLSFYRDRVQTSQQSDYDNTFNKLHLNILKYKEEV